jgi:hypothetical protein
VSNFAFMYETLDTPGELPPAPVVGFILPGTSCWDRHERRARRPLHRRVVRTVALAFFPGWAA